MKYSIYFSLLILICSQSLTRQRPPLKQSVLQAIIAEEHLYKSLYAPWREKYETDDTHEKKDEKECVFCLEVASYDDAPALILARFTHCIVLLNPYPYSRGHVLIIPHNHSTYLHELSADARAEIMEVMSASLEILKNELNIEGANVGINFEQVSGATIPDHLHVHIVPRQFADANFMRVIGNTSVVSWDLQKLYLRLKPCFGKLELQKTEH